MLGKRVVVTGGAGFIGSHLVRGLVDAGYEVTVLDNVSTGVRSNLAGVEGAVRIVEGDIRDRATLGAALTSAAIVFHEAADASVPRSIEDPGAVHELNATGTLAVLIAAREAGVRR